MNQLSSSRFFIFSIVFESLLLALAIGFGGGSSGPQTSPFLFYMNSSDFYVALVATILPVAGFILLRFSRLRNTVFFQETYGVVLASFGAVIKNLTTSELALISLMAGLGEEFFFRGALIGPLGAILSSAAFALFHAVSFSYFVLALIMGFYLAGVYQWTGNLLAPVIVHALYDFTVFLIIRSHLKRMPKTGIDLIA